MPEAVWWNVTPTNRIIMTAENGELSHSTVAA